jgi:hypothetical protein
MRPIISVWNQRMEEDRRREPRTRSAHPVYVRSADPNGQQFEEVRTMRDFSREGLYFLTEQSCYITGMQLLVIPAIGTLNLEYVAEVVRVERSSTGEYGVALLLLRVKDAMGEPQSAARSAFESFALAAAPIRAASR